MKNDDLCQNAAPVESGDLDELPETAIVGLAMLDERVERLLRFCGELERANQALRERNQALQSERDALRERNQALQTERDALHDRSEQSRARIEAMIVRLRDLEQAW